MGGARKAVDLKDIPLVNTDVDRHTLEYRVASLMVLRAFDDAKAIGKNRVRYFNSVMGQRSQLAVARYLAKEWQDLRDSVNFPTFAGMLRTVGMPVEETRKRIIETARGLHG